MFTLPAALKVDEFASPDAAAVKAAIDAALAELPALRNAEVYRCAVAGNLTEVASTADAYNGAERVLRQISMVLGETIKHGGTGKPVSPVVATVSPALADYEMPTRPVAAAPAPGQPRSVPMPAVAPAAAATASGGRSRRKVS